ncbi:ribose transport system ATP-binding protein [Rhodoligotrophos appendicifer]|uniref:sugar ABC transporter ATP-binding protein n=1 Tax=Rhodoligotrophos appendicifer TaxID=987056 RepID=UPI00117EEE5D|nr:sugar ABC transporter ATP-binding protein [Rhodoligotrophos appendicifer]
MSAPTATAISVVGVRKVFGATVAVDDVSFDIKPGTAHALLGENGAGKSTLVKMMSGLIEPDEGHLEVAGERVRLRSPRIAHARGIQTAFQEMTLVPDLTVLDNMLLPYAPQGVTGMIRRRTARERVEAHFTELGIDVDLWAEVGELDLAIQQKIEIARAVSRQPKILLLDEPTSTLAGRDVDWLGEIIATLKGKGVTIVFISHRMREVRAFCDRLTILRNGKHITTDDVGALSEAQVIEMIVGRSLSQAFPKRPPKRPDPAPEVLSAQQLSVGEKLRDVDFSLRRGEILGVAGLQGMGQLDLFLACFGMADLHRGQIKVDGRPVTIASPADAMRSNIGIGLVPEDRKTEALFLKLSGKHNVSLPVIGRFSRMGLIRDREETSAVEEVFDRVEVNKRALWTSVKSFSGGNQQKIAIAKWLLAESRILLLFDPTRGIDVGTKHELYMLMRNFAEAGGSVLFHSTEIPELVHLCDRVMVLYGGRVAAELDAEAATEQAIMTAALGGSALDGLAA